MTTMADKENTGGYDHRFVEEPPDSLKCLICLLVAREPHQHASCGKLFCSSCISKYMYKRNMTNNCPHCRQPFKNTAGHLTIFNDFKSDQEVKSLTIYCSTDCGWKGDLGSLDDHKQNKCENSYTLCPNECPTKQILRKNLEEHLESKCIKRLYSCEHCGEEGCFDERTTTHLDACPQMTIECARCSVSILRCEAPKHLLVCEFEPVSCKYAEIGCEEKPLRQVLKKHEDDDQFHLQIALSAILELKREMNHVKTDAACPAVLKMVEFEKHRKEKYIFYSAPFYTSKKGYKMCLGVDANGDGFGEGTHVSVFAYLMKGHNDDSLSWPFTGTITFELLNQLEDKNHHKKSVDFTAADDEEIGGRVIFGNRAKIGYGSPEFISHAKLGYQYQTQYLKDDTLIFRISVHLPHYRSWLECTV